MPICRLRLDCSLNPDLLRLCSPTLYTVTVHAAGDSAANQKAPSGESTKDTASEGAAAAKNAATEGASAAKNTASNGASAAKDTAAEGAKLASKAGRSLLAASAMICARYV